MAAINLQTEIAALDMDNDWLVVDQRQPDGTFRTRKIKPSNSGFALSSFGYTPENIANKDTDGTLAANSDTKYPSQKAVKTYVDAAVAATGVAPEISNGDGFAIDYFESYSVGAISVLDEGNGWTANGVATNCAIVSRTTHNSIAQKRLQITGAGEIGRRMPWGAKWNRIRIGILCRINASASFDGIYGIGVCSGTSAMYGSATPTNWAGSVQLDSASDTFTFSNSTQNSNVVSQSYEGEWRVGASSTSLGGSWTTAKFAAPTTEAWLSGFFVDIYRDLFTGSSAVGYTHDNFAANDSTKTQRHMTRSHFYKLMQAQNPATDSSLLMTAGTGHPLTGSNIDEVAGVFDSVNFYWANASNPIELAAFAVFKLY